MDWKALPPLTALRAFAATAERGSLTEAAKALNVTHAAVSQQIRSLESHLGTRLMVRGRRGVTLTAQGEHLARGLGPAFARIADLTEAISSAEAARPILVSVTPMFASAFLVPRLAGFMQDHPEVQLSLSSTIEAVDLKPGGVDMAIRYGTGDWPGLEAELLLPGCLTVVAAKGLIVDRVPTRPEDLLQLPILQEHASVEFDQWLAKVQVPEDAPRRVVRVPGNMLLDGIRRGDGVGATVPAFIQEELRSGDLVPLFDDPVPGIGYYMVTLPGARRRPLRTFMTWLGSSVTDLEMDLWQHHPLTGERDR